MAFDSKEKMDRGTILIVDDEGDIRKIIRLLLEKKGYEYVARKYFRPRLYWLRRFKHWVKRIN